MKHVLTIAGSDSGGGAGIQADLKVFSALGTYGMSVITALTAQNTVGVFGVEWVKPEMVSAQINAVFEDIRVDAVKIGMVANQPIIEAVADGLEKHKPPYVVLDPVMVAKSGDKLLQEDAIAVLKKRLLPLATLITPNLPEAETLLGRKIDGLKEMEQAAKELAERYGVHALVKGGHLSGAPVDVLSTGRVYKGKRVDTKHTHGTGCSLSSAIAAYLARGEELETAVGKAKHYVEEAIRHAEPIGAGHSPIHHFYRMGLGE